MTARPTFRSRSGERWALTRLTLLLNFLAGKTDLLPPLRSVQIDTPRASYISCGAPEPTGSNGSPRSLQRMQRLLLSMRCGPRNVNAGCLFHSTDMTLVADAARLPIPPIDSHGPDGDRDHDNAHQHGQPRPHDPQGPAHDVRRYHHGQGETDDPLRPTADLHRSRWGCCRSTASAMETKACRVRLCS